MKRLMAVALSASMTLAAGTARADWSIGAGFEGFQWKESTSPTVEETGLRWSLDLTWTQSRAPGVSAGYNLKFYNGNVDYDGATLFGGTPISGETRYKGLVNEVRAYYRTPQMIDFMLAAGWDRWDRKLSVAQEESWDVIYVRLGATFNEAVKQGFIASAGVKYPVWTRENANFTDLGALSNPRLRPGKDVSFYGTIGYRVNQNWDVLGYYDSYRFKEADLVAVPFTTGTLFAFQPESKMDVFGLKIQHTFY